MPYGRQRRQYRWTSSLLSCDFSIINYKSKCTLPPLRRLEQFSSSLKRIQRVLTQEYLIMSLLLRASQVSFHLSRLLLKTSGNTAYLESLSKRENTITYWVPEGRTESLEVIKSSDNLYSLYSLPKDNALYYNCKSTLSVLSN